MNREKKQKLIAGLAPADLLKEYSGFLFDEYLPFMKNHVVDHEFGGFLCHTDSSGNNISTDKRTWYDGRGIWVYSFLYNHFRQDPEYLKVAERTVELVLKAKSNNKELWPWSYSRSGKDLGEAKADIYGNLFVAEGLAEYAAACGDGSYWEKAKDILLQCVAIYDREDYAYQLDYGPDTSGVSAPRVLGHWMIMLRLATGMLRKREDAAIAAIANRCVEMLVERHLNPDFNLLVEVINHDLSLPKGPLRQFVYIGHAIEALWMIMDEALRSKDAARFQKASDMFKRHVEVAWDDVYGGVFHGLDHVEKNTWLLEKVLWAQEEVLVGLLMLIAHSDDPWAYRWFDKVYHHVVNTYPLKRHGYVLWSIGGDRKVTFKGSETRVENYHHPRHLMLNIRHLEQIISGSESS